MIYIYYSLLPSSLNPPFFWSKHPLVWYLVGIEPMTMSHVDDRQGYSTFFKAAIYELCISVSSLLCFGWSGLWCWIVFMPIETWCWKNDCWIQYTILNIMKTSRNHIDDKNYLLKSQYKQGRCRKKKIEWGEGGGGKIAVFSYPFAFLESSESTW